MSIKQKFRVILNALLVMFFVIATHTVASAQTLETVRERGHLICAAANPLPGFAQQSKEGLWSGFDVDFCRAVAAAVFSDPEKVEFRPLDGASRFAQLQVGEVDLISRNAPWTLQRDTRFQVHYTATSFIDGQSFMVRQSLGVVSAYELSDLSVCVIADGAESRSLGEFFFENQATYTEVPYEDREDLAVAYHAGLCDVVTASASWLNAIRLGLDDPAQHRILPERISKEPLGPMVRQGDDAWFNIVRWTLYVLLNAEELGVTSLNLDPLSEVTTPTIRRLLGLEDDFGAALGLSPDWMAQVIAAVGNYGEIYDRNFGSQTGVALLRGPNSLWTQGGLLYAMPIR